MARFTKTWRDLPDPMPMAPIPKAPKFPLDVLPKGVGDFCADQARALGVAVEMVAVPVLVVLAGAIGRGARLRLREDFNVRACLWGMVIAPPGGTKTPALKAATRPLIEAEGVRAAPLREAQTKWLARKKEADAVEKGLDEFVLHDGFQEFVPNNCETKRGEEDADDDDDGAGYSVANKARQHDETHQWRRQRIGDCNGVEEHLLAEPASVRNCSCEDKWERCVRPSERDAACNYSQHKQPPQGLISNFPSTNHAPGGHAFQLDVQNVESNCDA
jgi:hypothetical protein